MSHDLYKDGDTDVPECVKDRNGQVVLGLCKKCGKGECDLVEQCISHGSDRELLELAAKACGIDTISDGEGGLHQVVKIGRSREWNPITDDGDALRLAVKLKLQVEYLYQNVFVSHECGIDSIESYGSDEYAATRRAIVRAAASIGEQMK